MVVDRLRRAGIAAGLSPAAALAPIRRLARSQASVASDPWIAAHLDELVKLYTHFHTHPELSRDEVETSKRVAAGTRESRARASRRTSASLASWAF